jgi:hypothetical protein
VINYPKLFAAGSIWERFPYLLPNLVCTVIVTFGVLIGILFLEETHSEKKYRRDPGLEAGRWLLARFAGRRERKASRNEKIADLDEILSLLSEDDQPPGYSTTDGSPSLPPTPSSDPLESSDLNVQSAPMMKLAASRAFTRQVILNIAGYGILA